jgi:hypothetical protein
LRANVLIAGRRQPARHTYPVETLEEEDGEQEMGGDFWSSAVDRVRSKRP